MDRFFLYIPNAAQPGLLLNHLPADSFPSFRYKAHFRAEAHRFRSSICDYMSVLAHASSFQQKLTGRSHRDFFLKRRQSSHRDSTNKKNHVFPGAPKPIVQEFV